MKESSRKIGFSRPAALILWLLPLLTGLICIGLGRYAISPREVLLTLLRKGMQLFGAESGEALRSETIVWTMRVPRVLLAMLVGGGLSVAGAAFQSLFSNPLATPDTLGVASGASLGAALGLLWGLPIMAVQVLALLCGFLAVALTFLVGSKRESAQTMTSIVLAGMVISSLFTAFVSLVKYVADSDSQLPAITYWLMGSLASAVWPTLRFGAPFLIAGIIVLVALRWRLNILPLSEDEARATGVHLTALRVVVSLAATMITAASVAMCGQVAWIGLLIPHICRMLFGSESARLVPASLSLGAVFMTLVDTLSRSATASEIPISILTAIIGAPFFIHLLRQSRGWNS